MSDSIFVKLSKIQSQRINFFFCCLCSRGDTEEYADLGKLPKRFLKGGPEGVENRPTKEKRENALSVWSPSKMLSLRLVPTACVGIACMLHGEAMGVGLAQSAGTF